MKLLTDVWLDEWDAQIWSRDREGDALLQNWAADTSLDESDEEVLLGDWQKIQESLEALLNR
ncbi:MAG TPA: hypothetical protein DEG17_10425 [Cyanobacteria bacterium UBA11149]|nr:hypothetical protein [Cyanobacteria bacterium UBA11367]HBE56416.1 hypothetical protein [Cyanobacteria bacterium UBA11366]HBK66554.1 hypothetical protein [Cyanobacteria bacterium UBA11166]HBR72955.1 hypothetical protein [Cyanobacteria bacterium UBA11159]HBS70896.1 hypothetical protein [Cyanobacteria bacterium UBA11153]HBW89264.1 hypothetical protein [Cyanobacteria bacterium UBA11149]HCA97452.1 hypothetical protein [Cyanobacteria bacterium UBA9226]